VQLQKTYPLSTNSKIVLAKETYCGNNLQTHGLDSAKDLQRSTWYSIVLISAELSREHAECGVDREMTNLQPSNYFETN
jgi:hypothetical protein